MAGSPAECVVCKSSVNAFRLQCFGCGCFQCLNCTVKLPNKQQKMAEDFYNCIIQSKQITINCIKCLNSDKNPFILWKTENRKKIQEIEINAEKTVDSLRKQIEEFTVKLTGLNKTSSETEARSSLFSKA